MLWTRGYGWSLGGLGQGDSPVVCDKEGLGVDAGLSEEWASPGRGSLCISKLGENVSTSSAQKPRSRGNSLPPFAHVTLRQGLGAKGRAASLGWARKQPPPGTLHARPGSGSRGLSSLCHAHIFREVNHGVACGDTGLWLQPQCQWCTAVPEGLGAVSPSASSCHPPSSSRSRRPAVTVLQGPLGLVPAGGLESRPPLPLRLHPQSPRGSACGPVLPALDLREFRTAHLRAGTREEAH